MESFKGHNDEGASFKELFKVFKKHGCVRSLFISWGSGHYLITKNSQDLRTVLTDMETELAAHKQLLVNGRVRALKYGDERADTSKNPIAN